MILKSTVRKFIEINLENLWILGLKGLKPTARLVFRLYAITVVSMESGNNAQVDCKTVGFFLKISEEIDKAWRKNLTRA